MMSLAIGDDWAYVMGVNARVDGHDAIPPVTMKSNGAIIVDDMGGPRSAWGDCDLRVRQNLGRSKFYVSEGGRSPNQPCNSVGLGDGVILRKTEQFPSRFSFV